MYIPMLPDLPEVTKVGIINDKFILIIQKEHPPQRKGKEAKRRWATKGKERKVGRIGKEGTQFYPNH